MTPTPLLKIDNFYLKREDANTTGSAKDRAIKVQIENLSQQSKSRAVISSTGNAAISAIHYCRQAHIDLTIFLPHNIDPAKLSTIKNQTDNFVLSAKPISDSIKFSKANDCFYLRQSTDPFALLGYQQIGLELVSQLPQISSIFIPVGSGTTLLGLSQKLSEHTKIFAIQSSFHCPISSIFDQNFQQESENLTDALTVRYLPLKNKILTTIKNSHGSGVVVQNKDIIEAQRYLNNNNVATSNEGALALAGLFKALKNNTDLGKFPVVLLTGAKR